MKSVIGIIVGNRGFFPDELAREGRENIIRILGEMGHKPIVLTPDESKHGAVETREDAKKCAQLFKEHAHEIDGIIVTLPNFGDERGVADTLKMAGLNVPVLIHADTDDPQKATLEYRRDSFCGKISVCNNLRQYNIPFSLTKSHTVDTESEEFRREVEKFAALCRVVNGVRAARIGTIGARPANFTTLRFSEKILEHNGISTVPIDLSEILGSIEKLKDTDETVQQNVKNIKSYMKTEGVSDTNLLKMAKLRLVIDTFIRENDLDATAIQCWTALEEHFGVVPCTVLSMLSDSSVPSACEVDAAGALAMYALQLASETPSAILDWNNNYGDDPEKCVLFHCSNLPKHFIPNIQMGYQAIIAGAVGKEHTFGTCEGRIKANPMTYTRISTDDINGSLIAYLGEGSFTDDEFQTFGGYGVAHIPNLQSLMQFMCEHGFEHHVAVSLSQTAEILDEAFTKYLNIATYYHK